MVSGSGAVRKMKDDGPSESPCEGETSNRHMLRRLRPFVVSDVFKRRQLRRRVGVRKTIAGDVSLFNFRCHQNRRVLVLSGRVRRVPADWPDGDRHGGDVSLTCCFRRERGKVHPDTAARSRAATGRPSSSRNCERLSTVAGCAGGPVRSSDETSVMGAERRSWVIRGWFVWSTGRSPGGTR